MSLPTKDQAPAKENRGGGLACRLRPPAGPAGLVVALLGLLLFCSPPLQAAPVKVRFSEGMVRGFLMLTDSKGHQIGAGDFMQVPKDGEIRCRVRLHLNDGSLHDETALFTQQREFVLKSYHLVQKGPSFPQDLEASVERATGKYRVKTKGRKEEKEKVLEGKLELPLDVYNGIIPTVGKNLPEGATETVHWIAFTPKPQVIELEMIPSGADRVLIGELKKSAVHYLIKPKLGLLAVPAALLGRTPPDNHLWVITAEVPAFVRFDGPLAPDGPVWSIQLTSPVWPK